MVVQRFDKVGGGHFDAGPGTKILAPLHVLRRRFGVPKTLAERLSSRIRHPTSAGPSRTLEANHRASLLRFHRCLLLLRLVRYNYLIRILLLRAAAGGRKPEWEKGTTLRTP